jgi:CRISPR/Cas system-associated exonuclease Cas4 (RecB family)
MNYNSEYLSYSSKKTYTNCPKQYEYRYISKPKIETDPRNAIFGISIGKIFEWFYRDKIWSNPNPDSDLLLLIDKAIESASHEKKFDISSDKIFFNSIKNELNTFVPIGLKIIQDNKLLSLNSQAEFKLDLLYKHEKRDYSVKLAGRADFIHYKESGQIWILDGKSSKYKGVYADPEQLIWYAMLHYIKYHKSPTRIGYIFYRFPEDPVQWIHYDENSLRKCLNSSFEVLDKIRLRMFNPSPSVECKICDYKSICEEGKKFLSSEKKLSDSLGMIERI